MRIAPDRLTNKQRIPINGFVKAAEPLCYESGFFDFVTIIQLFHCESYFEPFAVTVLIYALNISCGGAAGSAGRWQIPSSWHLSCRFLFYIHCSRNHMQAIFRVEDVRFNRLLRFFRWCQQYQRNSTRITLHVYSTLFISESNTVREPVIIQSMMYSWMDCINSVWLEYLFYFETDQFVQTMTVEKGLFFWAYKDVIPLFGAFRYLFARHCPTSTKLLYVVQWNTCIINGFR